MSFMRAMIDNENDVILSCVFSLNILYTKEMGLGGLKCQRRCICGSIPESL